MKGLIRWFRQRHHRYWKNKLVKVKAKAQCVHENYVEDFPCEPEKPDNVVSIPHERRAS